MGMEAVASGRSVAGSTVALLVVPQGTHRPEPLAAAIAEHHPDWLIVAVWCGDPHLRPVLTSSLRWCDADADAETAADATADDWELMLVAAAPVEAEWARSLTIADAFLAAGATAVVALRVGAVAVVAPIDGLFSHSADVGLIALTPTALPPDGAAPSETDLADAGAFSTSVFVARSGARPGLQWMQQRLREAPSVPVGRWLSGLHRLVNVAAIGDPALGVGAWRWDTTAPALLDLPGFEVNQLWVLDQTIVGPARIGVVGHEDRVAALTAAASQLAGERTSLTLPGGVEVDEPIRTLVAAALARPSAQQLLEPHRATDSPPAPWNAAPAFRTWLAQRYWTHLHRTRRDLAAVFPEPDGRDAEAFRDWQRRALVDSGVSLLVRPAAARADLSCPRLHVASVLRTDGFNLVGYLTREVSLGDVARRLAGAAEAASLSVAKVGYQRTTSPELDPLPVCDQSVRFDTTVAVVTADQFAPLAADHPELFAATRRMVGYWFWELETITAPMRAALSHVDEVWAGSKFVADAFAAATPKPVRHIPISIPQPAWSERDRTSFAPLADLDGRFVFIVVFDHLSVTERKNPVGAIEAFCRAFAPGEGPVLVVKSMNGVARWPQHQHVLYAAGDRPDIRVWDEHLDRRDQMALVRSADCMVSLHRSEGLGLHLAEAMWLGVPTIATRYSGNVDFMDDTCALMVEAGRTAVVGGQGVYPPTAMWADPDLDQASAHMRRIVADAGLRKRLAEAGRERMRQQPSAEETGRSIARALGLRE
jgi:glycosyltransferase involved in cell wall biosynthesis